MRQAGDVIGGRYRLLDPIGEGGLCEVWRAEDRRAGRVLALKWLKPAYRADSRLRRRMHREARAVARLEHPHIVRLYDVDDDDGVGPYIAMEWLRGMSLTERLHVGMSLDDLLDATDEILDALAYAHVRGVVHRDLKPDNVVVSRGADGRETIKLLDFGFAWLEGDTDAGLSQPMQDIFGTPTYMAPEQITHEGELGPWTDLYALCVMLWELITGDPPFAGKTSRAVVVQHITAPLPPFVPIEGLDVPRGLEAILRRGLEKEPAARFATAAEMQRVLRAVRAGDGVVGEVIDPDDGPLIGRIEVQRWLWEHAVRACEDQVLAAVVIESAPGLGRTRLCRWLRQTMADGGWMLPGMGQADADGIRAALRDALQLPDEPEVPPVEALVLAFEALELARSEAADAVADFIYGSGPFGSRDPARLAFVLRHLASRRPLLLCLDDLQIAGPDVMHALDHALGVLERAPAPVMLLCTRRMVVEGAPDGELPGEMAFDEAMIERRQSLIARRVLPALGADAMAMFAAHALGLDAAATAPVLAAAAGNPLYATHAVYALHEQDILRRTEDGYVPATEVPPLPADPIALTRARLDRLFHSKEHQLERRLAECFALIGDALPDGAVHALAAAFDTRPQRLAEGIDSLIERGVMVRDGAGRVRFTHRLISVTMRADVAIRSDAAILFGRIADALGRLPRLGRGPTTAERAGHALAGGLIADAVDIQIEAALEALEHGWPQVAAGGLESAADWLTWVPEDRARHAAGLRLGLARWALATERFARALTEADAAAAWADRVMDRGVAAIGRRIAGEAALGLRQLDEATTRLRLAEVAGDGQAPAEAARRMLAGGRLALARGLLPEARIRIGQAHTRFGRLDDGLGQARCQLALGLLAERAGETRNAVSRYREVVERADGLAEAGLRGRAMLRIADLQRRMGRDDTAIALYEAAVEALRHADRDGSRARALRGLGECRLRRGGGSITEPFRLALALFEERGESLEAAACATRLGHTALDRGETQVAEALYARALTHFDPAGGDPRVGLLHAFIARAAHRSGQLDRRERHLQAALDIDGRAPLRSVEWPLVLDEIAEGLLREGRIESGRRLQARATHIRLLLSEPTG